MSRNKAFVQKFVWPLVLCALSCAPAWGEIRPDFEMDHDPEIRLPPPVKAFSDRQKLLWLQALARPEADMQRMAAEAIARGHAFGIPGMEEAVPGLVAILTSSSSQPAARVAAAQALVRLDAKEAAEQMSSCAEKYSFDVRQVVEPALAAWDYEPARAAWRERLKGTRVRHRDLLLAIRCLATVRDKSAAADLLAIAHDRLRSPDIRAEAALSAGVLQDRGLEADSRRLMAGDLPPLVDRLCAVRLLARHTGDDAQRMLAQFAVDAEPAVAVMALTRLLEIDPHLVLSLAEQALQNPDAKVRQCGADAYVRVPDPQRVAVLARVLDDPHPGVRSSVRESLFELAGRRELDGPIRSAAMGVLAGKKWRGLEQAALLLAALDHKPAAGRLVELLDFDRAEVGVAAAWGLKRLAISETLPAMLEKGGRNAELSKRRAAPDGTDDQTAHLFEALGRMKYAAAEPLFLQHVPKNFTLGVRARSAAIWSLGWLHEGVPDESLAAKLRERIEDFGPPPIPAELDLVKHASAASIVRMKATSQAAALRKLITPRVQRDRVLMAVRWAVIELTGEQIPEPEPLTIKGIISFLQPLDDSSP
jgi:hypothetical protein